VSLVRRAAKRDQSEKAIVEYLRKAGWSVLHLSVKDGPDLCIGRRTTQGGINLLIECKTGKGKLRPGQQDWAKSWNGHPPYVFRTVEDAEALTKAINCLGGCARG
jgi:hypothetical protein